MVRKFFAGMLTIAFLSGILMMASASVLIAGEGPSTNNGKKWRIGYYEGGEYTDYQMFLAATVRGLMESGWVEKASLPEMTGEETKALWEWLARPERSKYLMFVPDAHYSADWDEKKRENLKEEIIGRLNEKGDIDMMLALGTWAGQDLANDRHKVPTMVMSASDPVAAGIVESEKDSGRDHIHAQVDPLYWRRQVETFYDTVGFERMGIMYEDTVSGRSIAALTDVESVAGEKGFALVRCHTIDDSPDKSEAEESVLKCMREILPKVDAVYLTMQNGVNENTISRLVSMANERKTPMFSSGTADVEKGVLMSISNANFKYHGLFHAGAIGEVLKGTPPRRVNMIFESPVRLAINLKTAKAIGYAPSADVIIAAEEIYE